jgi:hypothetical protein
MDHVQGGALKGVLGSVWCLQNTSFDNKKIYILLSSSWNFLQNWSYFSGKASLSKYKKIEITPGILFDHIAIKLELINKNNSRKYTTN